MGKGNGEEDIEMMDTPDRCKNKQIATSVCKFEESPVFTFLNSLSPINPVKPTHITQAINPLTFASLQSVFTSPHVSSLKDYRLLQRCQLFDPSNPEFSSDNGSTADKIRANMEASKKLDDQKENRDLGASNGEMAISDLAENLSYDCKSPDSNLRPICALKAKNMAEYSHSSSTALFVEEASHRGLSGKKENLRGITQTDPSREASSCDWESLISDATDMLIFESPNDSNSYKKSIDPVSSVYTSKDNEVPNTRSPVALASADQVREGSEPDNMSTQPGEGSEMMENAEIHDINNPREKMDYEHISGFYRGMRRRCLVFGMAEARRKQLDGNSGPHSPALLQSNDKNSTNEQQLVPAGTESSRSVLPGIGLHLNTLATTPKNYKIVSYEASANGRFLIGPTSSVNIHPPTSPEQLNNNSAVASSEREFDTINNGILLMEDVCDVSGYIINEDIYQSGSPKKKRRRPEEAVEDGACKRCNCKKSKCLKLYCECFAAGVYCVEPCTCIDCFNKPVHEDTVLATRKHIESRNPLAFAPKVIRGSDSVLETGDDSSTPASSRHKRGCNCKKSGCLKKYCECYQGGVGCSINCRCEGCKNAFGRKDGSCVMGMDVEIKDAETDTTEKSIVDKSLNETAIQNELEQNMDYSPLATPLRSARQSVSKNKPPRSSFTSIGSSSNPVANQVFDKPNFFQPPSKFDKHFETVWEDEIPEFLQVSSPIKSSSPNQKRVSSPHSAGMSGLRSSRKLILKSIPSFPSLGPSQ